MFEALTPGLEQAVVDLARTRMSLDPVPLDGSATPTELAERAGPTVTPDGIGGLAALRVFDEVLSRACISADHPRNLAFIPAAPTRASILFDLVVGASSIYGGSWLEGAGAVHAENEALRWLSELVGFPAEAGGAFVQGGTIGNLSALVAARHAARARRAARGLPAPARWSFLCGSEAHSSLRQAAEVMDVDAVFVAADDDGRLTGQAVAAALGALGTRGPGLLGTQGAATGTGGDSEVFAVVATAGSTQFGVVDDIRGIVDAARPHDLWVHVDGAYGLAGVAAPSTRHLFDGVGDADSFIVDPHKWLFAPFDACALVYRDPAAARAAHAQQAGYLEVLDRDSPWNPSDYQIGLSRRVRGLPFWFSLATYGTRAYSRAVEGCLATARAAADRIRELPYVELVREPELSVVVLRRLGWSAEDYHRWTTWLLGSGLGFVTPTVHNEETVTRFAIVNPRTTPDDIDRILATMSDGR
ncbi:glutamate decarboxylase [Frankia sp. R43]|uniref:pyridoxal phosphate-dependent decarboxylase family protein n=1 Tax=Frankia sp. R43 TaxID=269536 RepID=UPI0006CA2E86|nr:pyridoxal-dependent decarboxylase [Frankia sp. R43]KPM53546.1 glutamate decarboxylase [Frankia sp. R43]